MVVRTSFRNINLIYDKGIFNALAVALDQSLKIDPSGL